MASENSREAGTAAPPAQRAGGRGGEGKMQKTVVVAVERLVRHAAVPQDHPAHLHVHGPRREGRQAGRHRAHRGDAAALQAQALARGGDPGARAGAGDVGAPA